VAVIKKVISEEVQNEAFFKT